MTEKHDLDFLPVVFETFYSTIMADGIVIFNEEPTMVTRIVSHNDRVAILYLDKDLLPVSVVRGYNQDGTLKTHYALTHKLLPEDLYTEFITRMNTETVPEWKPLNATPIIPPGKGDVILDDEVIIDDNLSDDEDIEFFIGPDNHNRFVTKVEYAIPLSAMVAALYDNPPVGMITDPEIVNGVLTFKIVVE